jgi:hypothetical protein
VATSRRDVPRHRAQQQLVRRGVEKGFRVQIDDPVRLPAPLPTKPHRLDRRAAKTGESLQQTMANAEVTLARLRRRDARGVSIPRAGSPSAKLSLPA